MVGGYEVSLDVCTHLQKIVRDGSEMNENKKLLPRCIAGEDAQGGYIHVKFTSVDMLQK